MHMHNYREIQHLEIIMNALQYAIVQAGGMLNEHGLRHTLLRIGCTATVLNLALKIVMITHRPISMCLCAVTQPEWDVSCFHGGAIVQGLGALGLGTLLG